MIYPTPHSAYALYRRKGDDKQRFFPLMLAAIIMDSKGCGHAGVFTRSGELVRASKHLPLKGFQFYRVMSAHQVEAKFQLEGPFFVPRTDHTTVLHVFQPDSSDEE